MVKLKKNRNPDEVWKDAYWISHDTLLETYGNAYRKSELYKSVTGQPVDFEEYLTAIKKNKSMNGGFGMLVSVFLRLCNNVKEFPHIDLSLHSWKICVFAANPILPQFDRAWLMEDNADGANIKREYEGGDVYEYAQTNVFEDFAYDAHHCDNCNRIGFSSDIEKLLKTLPQFQSSSKLNAFANGAICESLKLCDRCREARYCSVECQREHWKIHKKRGKKKKKKKKKKKN
jgi:hypothetical protein